MAFAQTKLELKQTAFFIEKTLRVNASPQIGIKENSHQWSIGPTILIADEKIASEKVFPKLTGFSIKYKYFPVTPRKNIDFFIFSESTFQRIKDHWTSESWSNLTQSYHEEAFLNIETIYFLHLGYGIELKLGKHLFVNNSMAMGAYHSSTKNENLSGQSSALPFYNKNINGYPGNGFSWQLAIALGYSF